MGLLGHLIKKRFELQQHVGFGPIRMEQQIDPFEQLAVQLVLVATGQFQHHFKVFVLLPEFAGQRIERRVVGLGRQ
jgi:hypothetical protein